MLYADSATQALTHLSFFFLLVTVDLLFHLSAPTSPTNVIVERSGSAYSLWWNGDLGRKVMTFVHMCYTIPLQLQGPGDANRNQSSEAAEPLNCVVRP